jgi:uncharacterized protein
MGTGAALQAADSGTSPGFDCGKTLNRAETLICASPELASHDADMADLYKGALASPARWHATMQRRWLAERNQCPDADCLLAAYKQRLGDLDTLKYLDWDNETAYLGVLDIAKDQAALMRAQQAWRGTLDSCGNFACIKRAFQARQAELETLKKTVARAGMQRYVNQALGIGFDYLGNRTVNVCKDQPDCVELKGAAMGEGSGSILEISVIPGDLATAASAMWERRGNSWFATGRGSAQSEVAPYTEGWQGLHASTMCGFSDRNGFHAGGECNTYLRSSGKRSIVIRDDGVSGKDAASLATVASVHFLRPEEK